MSDALRPMFTNEGLAVRACRGHFHVTVGGCDLALPGDPYKTREAALDVALSEAVATVAALTAENERLRSTLTDVLACVGGGRLASIGSADNVRCPQIRVETIDRWRAALPSSRETTDGQ